jgi:hypothetical protein
VRHSKGVALLDQVAGVGAVHVVHRYPEPAVELATVVHPDDVGMPQRRGELGLARESGAELVVVRGIHGQDLEGIQSRQPRMLGEIDLSHSASAEQPLNGEAGENVTVVERHA